MPFRLEITDNSIHAFEQKVRTLKDQDTGEIISIPDPGHGSAIGLGDFTTRDDKGAVVSVDTEGFKSAVAAMIVDVCGPDLAKVIAAKAAEVQSAAADAAAAIDPKVSP